MVSPNKKIQVDAESLARAIYECKREGQYANDWIGLQPAFRQLRVREAQTILNVVEIKNR